MERELVGNEKLSIVESEDIWKNKKVPDKNQLTKISSTGKIANAPFCTYQPPAAVGNNTKHWLYLTGFCSWSTLRLPQTKTKIPFAEVG